MPAATTARCRSLLAIPSPLAILKGTGNITAAQAFVDHVLSKEGQETLVQRGNYVPARTDVDPPEGTPSADTVVKLAVDWDTLWENRQLLAERWAALVAIEETPR